MLKHVMIVSEYMYNVHPKKASYKVKTHSTDTDLYIKLFKYIAVLVMGFINNIVVLNYYTSK